MRKHLPELSDDAIAIAAATLAAKAFEANWGIGAMDKATLLSTYEAIVRELSQEGPSSPKHIAQKPRVSGVGVRSGRG